MTINMSTTETGPYKVVLNGRTLATRHTRRQAESLRVPGAVVAGRRVLVAEFS